MAYSITTKDGITINNIPDDVDPNSDELKQRVSRLRSGEDRPPQSALAAEPQELQKQGRMGWWAALKDSFSPEALIYDLTKISDLTRTPGIASTTGFRVPELKGDLKTMNEVGPRDLPMKGLLATLMIPDVNERATALKNQGHSVKDVHGVPVITLKNGKRKMLNRPGWSMADAATLGAEMIKYSGAGKAVRMFKGIGKKMLVGAAGHGATSHLEQKGQEALGGTYDPKDVALTTLVGGGAEALIPLLGKLHRQLSPATKAAYKNAKTIEEIQQVTGWSEEEIIDTVRGSLGKNATPVEAGVPLSKEKLLVAALDDPKKARKLQEQYAKDIEGARGKFGRTFSALTDTDIIDGVAGAKSATGDMMKSQIKHRSIFSSIFYNDALKDVGNIDTQKYVDMLESLIKSQANPSDPTELGLRTYINQLESRAYRDAVKANKNKVQLLDQSGRAIAQPLPPRWEKDATLFHNVIKDLRSRSALANSESNTPTLKAQLAKIEKMMVDDLDGLSAGKFKLANKAYAGMTADLDVLAKGHVGKTAKLGDLQIGEFLKSIFEQRKVGNIEVAEKFMKLLTKRDPKAASDLYGSYFLTKIDELDGTAKSFNSALFEKGAKIESNPVYRFAPNPEAKKRIKELHGMFKKAEEFENLGLVKGADGRWVAKKMDTEMEHLVYVRQAFSRAIGKGQRKRIGEAWFEFATNPKWADDWDKIIEGRKTMMKAWPKGKLANIENAHEYANASRSAFKDIDEVTVKIINALSESDWLSGVRPGAQVMGANTILGGLQTPISQSEQIELRN